VVVDGSGVLRGHGVEIYTGIEEGLGRTALLATMSFRASGRMQKESCLFCERQIMHGTGGRAKNAITLLSLGIYA
jgi:hypothetical protein